MAKWYVRSTGKAHVFAADPFPAEGGPYWTVCGQGAERLGWRECNLLEPQELNACRHCWSRTQDQKQAAAEIRLHANTVEMIGHYGGDTQHALAAWTSTSRDLPSEKLARVDALLSMLATEGHTTPFERSTLHFLVRTDIATHIHLLKHRIGVGVNGESARYKELKDRYYLPADWPEFWRHRLQAFTNSGNSLYRECLNSLVRTHGMPRKRAKETARYFKSYNSQLEADVIFNFRSFAHFQYLRNDEHAQGEIRDIAQQMLAMVRSLPEFAGTIRAFELAGIIPQVNGIRRLPPAQQTLANENEVLRERIRQHEAAIAQMQAILAAVEAKPPASATAILT